MQRDILHPKQLVAKNGKWLPIL